MSGEQDSLEDYPPTFEERLQRLLERLYQLPSDGRLDLTNAAHYVINLYSRDVDFTADGDFNLTRKVLEYAMTHDYSPKILESMKNRSVYRDSKPGIARLCDWIDASYKDDQGQPVDPDLAGDIRRLIRAIDSELPRVRRAQDPER